MDRFLEIVQRGKNECPKAHGELGLVPLNIPLPLLESFGELTIAEISHRHPQKGSQTLPAQEFVLRVGDVRCCGGQIWRRVSPKNIIHHLALHQVVCQRVLSG